MYLCNNIYYYIIVPTIFLLLLLYKKNQINILGIIKLIIITI